LTRAGINAVGAGDESHRAADGGYDGVITLGVCVA